MSDLFTRPRMGVTFDELPLAIQYPAFINGTLQSAIEGQFEDREGLPTLAMLFDRELRLRFTMFAPVIKEFIGPLLAYSTSLFVPDINSRYAVWVDDAWRVQPGKEHPSGKPSNASVVIVSVLDIHTQDLQSWNFVYETDADDRFVRWLPVVSEVSDIYRVTEGLEDHSGSYGTFGPRIAELPNVFPLRSKFLEWGQEHKHDPDHIERGIMESLAKGAEFMIQMLVSQIEEAGGEVDQRSGARLIHLLASPHLTAAVTTATKRDADDL